MEIPLCRVRHKNAAVCDHFTAKKVVQVKGANVALVPLCDRFFLSDVKQAQGIVTATSRILP